MTQPTSPLFFAYDKALEPRLLAAAVLLLQGEDADAASLLADAGLSRRDQRLYSTALVTISRMAFALAEAGNIRCGCPEGDADGLEVLRRLLLHVTRSSTDSDYALGGDDDRWFAAGAGE